MEMAMETETETAMQTAITMAKETTAREMAAGTEEKKRTSTGKPLPVTL